MLMAPRAMEAFPKTPFIQSTSVDHALWRYISPHIPMGLSHLLFYSKLVVITIYFYLTKLVTVTIHNSTRFGFHNNSLSCSLSMTHTILCKNSHFCFLFIFIFLHCLSGLKIISFLLQFPFPPRSSSLFQKP